MSSQFVESVTERVNEIFVACMEYSPILVSVVGILAWSFVLIVKDPVYALMSEKFIEFLYILTNGIRAELRAALEPDSLTGSNKDAKPGTAGPQPGMPGESDIPHPEVCHPINAEADETACGSASCKYEKEELFQEKEQVAKEKEALVKDNDSLRTEIAELKLRLQQRERSLMEVGFGRTTPAQTSPAGPLKLNKTKTAALRRIFLGKKADAKVLSNPGGYDEDDEKEEIPEKKDDDDDADEEDGDEQGPENGAGSVQAEQQQMVTAQPDPLFALPAARSPPPSPLPSLPHQLSPSPSPQRPRSLSPSPSPSPSLSSSPLPPLPPSPSPSPSPSTPTPPPAPSSQMYLPSPEPEPRATDVFAPVAALFKATEMPEEMPEEMPIDSPRQGSPEPELTAREFAPAAALLGNSAPTESIRVEEGMEVDKEVAPSPSADSDWEIYDASPIMRAVEDNGDMEMSVLPEPLQEAVDREVEMEFGHDFSPTIPSSPRPFSSPPANAFQSPSLPGSSSPSLELSPTSLTRSSPPLALSPASAVHSSPPLQLSPDSFAVSPPVPLSPVREETKAAKEAVSSLPPVTPSPASRGPAIPLPRPPPGVIRRPARSANPLLVPNRRKPKPQTPRSKDAPCAQLGLDGRAIPSPRPSPAIRAEVSSTPTANGSAANASPSPKTVTNISLFAISGPPPAPTPAPPRLHPSTPAVKRTNSASYTAVSATVFNFGGRVMAPLPARAAVPRSAADEDARRKEAEKSRRAWRTAEQQSSQEDAARAAEEAPRRRMPPVGSGETRDVDAINQSVLTVGSPEVTRELVHVLEPLWPILHERAIRRYGQLSLRQLAIRRWTEALEDDGYPRGSPLTRVHFERLVGVWIETLIDDLIAKRILLEDDQDVEEILDLWRGLVDQQGRLPPS